MMRRLNYILATDMKATLEESLDGLVHGVISIQTDERTNKIIITTDE